MKIMINYIGNMSILLKFDSLISGYFNSGSCVGLQFQLQLIKIKIDDESASGPNDLSSNTARFTQFNRVTTMASY